jgi:hypothetical protein
LLVSHFPISLGSLFMRTPWHGLRSGVLNLRQDAQAPMEMEDPEDAHLIRRRFA